MTRDRTRRRAPAGIAIAGCAALLVAGTWVSTRQAAPRAGDAAVVVPATVDAASHARTSRRAEVDARFRQGVVMLHARRYDHAIAALHRVIELEPRMPEAHVNLGFAFLGTGDPRAAHDFFAGAIALRASQANAWYGLAIASDALADRAQAIGAMRTYVHLAVEDDPYRRRAMAALWEWQAASGRHDPESALPPVRRADSTARSRTDAFGFPCFGMAGFDCAVRAPARAGAIRASALLAVPVTEEAGVRRTTP